MRIKWTRLALADFHSAQAYIAQDKPGAAQTMARRIWEAGQRLKDNPGIGRSGQVPGTREWVVSNTPYLIVYRECNDAIEILRVWHTQRNRK